MAVLDYSEIKPRKYIIHNDEPYEVLESQVSRTQKRKPQNQVKLKSLITGRVIPVTFHASDNADEADISRKDIKYLYNNKNEFWFCEIKDPSKRFTLSADLIGDNKKWLIENLIVEALIFDDGDEERVIGIKLPIKMTFEVKEAPPNVKGNSSGGVQKVVTLQNGTEISVPLFINQGDKVIVNTDTGEYSERA